MQRQLEQVEEFHRVFGGHVEERPAGDLAPEVVDLRARLLAEELEEYRRAAAAGDLVGLADALSDLLYVLLGTYVTHGLQQAAVALFDEVTVPT